MAYKQKPGRGNQAKTGHGIPAPFKQLEFIKAVGSKIEKAHEAGKTAFEGSRKASNVMGGFGGSVSGGVKRSYEKNPVEYVRGFVGGLVSEDNPKTNEKKKSPVKQKQKKQAPKKEEGLLDKAGKAISGAVETVKEKYKEFDKYMKEGSSPDSRYGGSQDRFMGVQLHGRNAGKMEGNSKTEEKKKSPAKMKMGKKTPAKMKKC